ncbi:nucleic acid/nucleotide deaminase domain-containing protein [Citrobacter sp.]|uniref:nucleic acid/nucleotide deaminase domain-containing protein n=1 Tax=Citrobacter sp. TaxID=1896336 RepID=UPI002FC89F85
MCLTDDILEKIDDYVGNVSPGDINRVITRLISAKILDVKSQQVMSLLNNIIGTTQHDYTKAILNSTLEKLNAKKKYFYDDKFDKILIRSFSYWGEDCEARKDLRDLDRAARILHWAFPDEKCIAVCWKPMLGSNPTRKLIISTNNCSKARESTVGRLTPENVAAKITSELTKVSVDKLKKSPEYLLEFNRRRPLRVDMASELMKWRVESSLKKFSGTDLSIFLSNIDTFDIIFIGGDNVHAEIRLLEYLETNYMKGGGKVSIDIGVSMRCCGKCSAFIYKYRKNKNAIFLPEFRGSHSVFDLSGWSLPDKLKSLESELGDALTFFERSSREAGDPSMLHDASDDESD